MSYVDVFGKFTDALWKNSQPRLRDLVKTKEDSELLIKAIETVCSELVEMQIVNELENLKKESKND